MIKKIFALLWLASICLPGAKYPPGLRWREIEQSGLTIIFPSARGAEAATALAAAESLNKRLASFWGFPLQGRMRIVLSDSTDDANGFATFFPFNLVGADLAEPAPDSELAASGPFLDLVLAHELTHLYTMNAGPPLFRGARRLFGSHPVLFPAVQLPPWVIEGLAVEGESHLSGDGRLAHAPYRLMLAAASRSGRFPSWSGLAGMPAAWPGPNGKYLFGAGFMEFLAEKYGRDALRRYPERFASRFLTLSSRRDFKKLFGQALDTLWQEYSEGISLPKRPVREPVAAGGFFNLYPCPLAEGSLAYYRRNYRGRGEVTRLNLESGKSEALFKMDAINGISCHGKEGKLLLSATESFHAFSDFSDLYEYDMKKHRLKRLSRGGRLSYPTRGEKPEWLYCVQRRDNNSRLALFSMKDRKARSISAAFAGMAQLALAPDGRRIAAAAKPAGRPWGIAVFLESGVLDRFLTVSENDLSQPRWQENGELVFIVSGRETSFLAAYSFAAESGRRLENQSLLGLRQFDFSSDGGEIFFTYYGGGGVDIARIPSAWIPTSPMEITVASGIPENSAASEPEKLIASRPYRPWRDLLPRWWSPALRAGGDEIQAGAMTGGQDALGIHSYTLEGYYGLESRRPNMLFQYAYDGLLPTLSIALGDSIDYNRGNGRSLRTRELKLASLWPLRLRKRSQLHAYADLHLEKRSAIYFADESRIGFSYNGFRLGARFSSAREYYDSISPADGVRFALQGFIHPAGLGNEQANRGIQADLRAYASLFRPGVLAWRLAAARSWEAGRIFYDMGGLAAEGGLGSSRPFRLLRGFGAGSFRGDWGWQFNLEYRLPLFKIEKAILPAVSLDRVWLAPFFDMGRLFYRYREYEQPAAFAAGAEAVLRLAFGGAAAYDVAFGVAHGFGPEKQWQVYLRSGRSF